MTIVFAANGRMESEFQEDELVLGTRSIGGVWFAPSHKVTNVNIFSSALSIERMKRMTGGERCVEEGDYLAWADMEWILHG